MHLIHVLGSGRYYGEGGGGLQNGRGGGAGDEKVLAMLNGVGESTKSFEVVLTLELEVLAILMGGGA